jgi:hypothetical protein
MQMIVTDGIYSSMWAPGIHSLKVLFLVVIKVSVCEQVHSHTGPSTDHAQSPLNKNPGSDHETIMIWYWYYGLIHKCAFALYKSDHIYLTTWN